MERFAKIASGTAAVAAAVAGVGLVGSTTSADAAVVYSGTQNVNVPANFDGIYLNLITAATGTSGAGTPGWDFNPYSASAGSWSLFTAANTAATTDDNAYVASASTGSGTLLNLSPGDPIGPASILNRAVAAFPSQPPGNVLFGVKFLAEGSNTMHYGWIRATLPGSGPGTIIEWAYESTPETAIAAGVVPEPASLSLLALGAAGLLRRRSKVA